MAMGRRRDPTRKGWPDNIYPCMGGFKYRHPVTKVETWLGKDKARAFDAAKKANAILVPRTDLVAKIVGEGHTVKDAINVFRREDASKRDWSEKTAKEYGIQLRRIEKDIGGKPIAEFGIREMAEYLKHVTDSERGRQQYRLLLIWVFACAVQDGWIESNPVESTRRPKATRQRARLTLEGYKAIYEQAPQWVRNAMDLGLQTLLRREDLCSLKFADHRDGFLWVVPSKTEGTTTVKLKIPTTGPIQGIIERCRDTVLSPFILHRMPEKARPSDKRAENRTHHTQVLPEQLTRAFADARDAAEMFAGAENPPTFHEIRSLGGKLYKDQGWTLDQVQALMGHASQDMTEHYLAGHETPWVEVAAGLKI